MNVVDEDEQRKRGELFARRDLTDSQKKAIVAAVGPILSAGHDEETRIVDWAFEVAEAVVAAVEPVLPLNRKLDGPFSAFSHFMQGEASP